MGPWSLDLPDVGLRCCSCPPFPEELPLEPGSPLFKKWGRGGGGRSKKIIVGVGGGFNIYYIHIHIYFCK